MKTQKEAWLCRLCNSILYASGYVAILYKCWTGVC